MEDRDILKELKSLCQLDIDAVHAYNESLRHIDAPDVKKQIESFRGDHERHINELSESIRKLGDEPPKFSKDFRGYVLDAFTKVRSLTGIEGALKALRSGENMTNKRYGEARNIDFPALTKELIEKNFRDEQRHLKYIEQAIDSRVWEKAA
ncbi:MAG: ferritin-like domain-containing protein [Deltaproteobacteria bacterium]|nr:ferritin-like domain-containing protein [Deltaproteobacteria bacterium]